VARARSDRRQSFKTLLTLGVLRTGHAKRKSQFAVGMAAPIFGDIGDGDDRGHAPLGKRAAPILHPTISLNKLTILHDLAINSRTRKLNPKYYVFPFLCPKTSHQSPELRQALSDF
jgi:hypothetical protein